MPFSRRDGDHFCFVLLPEFPLYALVPAIEALRLANQNSGRALYDWSFASSGGGPVRAGNGMTIEGPAIGPDLDPPSIVICGGNDPMRHVDRALTNWLRRRAAHGASLGALDTGAFALAAAGTLAGYTATLHWEAIPAFRDAFPDIRVVEQLYVIDRDRLTSAGGVASLDLMLAVIARDHGPRLAQIVADGFVHGRGRPPEAPQRLDTGAPAATETVWRRATRLMKDNFAFPLAIGDLCAELRIPRRQLERLAQRQTGRSPAAYYLDLRLEAAHDQIFYTGQPIAHVAEACGFLSPAHFSRAFRRRYAMTPSAYRARFGAAERERFHPAGVSLVASQNIETSPSEPLIPAQAGTQSRDADSALGPRLRGDERF